MNCVTCVTCGKPFAHITEYSGNSRNPPKYCSGPCRTKPRLAKKSAEQVARYRAIRLSGGNAIQAQYASASDTRLRRVKRVLNGEPR